MVQFLRGKFLYCSLAWPNIPSTFHHDVVWDADDFICYIVTAEHRMPGFGWLAYGDQPAQASLLEASQWQASSRGSNL